MKYSEIPGSSTATEFWSITEDGDPLKALDQCQAAIQKAGQAYWTKRRTYLGVAAELSNQICKSKSKWRRFVENKFWNNAVGSAPTMKNRSNGLGFILRYCNNAKSRKSYKLALRHAAVANYLVEHGVQPAQFSTYLGKPGQGMNKIYQRALAEKTAKGPAPIVDAFEQGRQPAKVLEDAGSAQAENIGTAPQGSDAKEGGASLEKKPTRLRKLRLLGREKVFQRLILLADGEKVDVRIEAIRDDKGRRCLKVVKLLSGARTTRTTSERRRGDGARPGSTRPSNQAARKPHRSVR